MASLTTDSRGRSSCWICCYTTSDGRRLKKSTKIRIKPQPGELGATGKQKTPADAKRDAMEVCMSWQRVEQMAGHGNATEQQVRRVMSETLSRIGARTVEQVTTRAWFNHWLDSKTGLVAKSTTHAYTQMSREFLAYLGKRADAPMESITPETIASYRDHLRDQGLAPGTLRNAIKKLLNSPFNTAWRAGKIPSNPCSSVEIESKRERASRKTPRDVFTAVQVTSILQVSPPDWKGAIMAAYYIGARLQDVANIRWIDLSDNKSVVTYIQRKTGGEVTCPLHPSLADHVAAMDDQASPWLFPSLAGCEEGGRNGLSRQFTALMEKAGIENRVVRERGSGKRSRTVWALTFHSLRHSFNSALANADVSIEMRQKLTGHTDQEMNKRYTHHELGKLREAVSKIPRV